MKKTVQIFRGYIQRLKTLWPRGIVTLGLAALAAGLTGIFRWVERQQDLDARMPEFIGLLLLAGILYVIGCFGSRGFASEQPLFSSSWRARFVSHRAAAGQVDTF